MWSKSFFWTAPLTVLRQTCLIWLLTLIFLQNGFVRELVSHNQIRLSQTTKIKVCFLYIWHLFIFICLVYIQDMHIVCVIGCQQGNLNLLCTTSCHLFLLFALVVAKNLIVQRGKGWPLAWKTLMTFLLYCNLFTLKKPFVIYHFCY